jgi:hypothetical protein
MFLARCGHHQEKNIYFPMRGAMFTIEGAIRVVRER